MAHHITQLIVKSSWRLGTALWIGVAVSSLAQAQTTERMGESQTPLPQFEVDAHWPKLPEQWVLGQVSGIHVDAQDHIWIVQRQGSLEDTERALAADDPGAMCCRPAPPVMEFDAEGNFIQGWGGPGTVPMIDGQEQWPDSEHGIFVDAGRNVWIGGGGANDSIVFKFTADGKFLKQFGVKGRHGNDTDKTLLGRPAEIWVDEDRREVYFADGYGNRRVIVYHADNGQFMRLWGANGKPPGDTSVPLQYNSPVHCIFGTRDKLIYVCDRINNRIQVFRMNKNAVEYVSEFYVAPETKINGSTWDVAASPDEKFLYVPDGTNQRIWIVERASGKTLGWFGRGGHYAGQFTWVHNIAVDSKGNVYASEVFHGKRAQKFVYKGLR